ncbi:MAG: sulfotransferase [Acidimicrobiales bacterium]|nr:sulfotransferase [Acidimicrobiales bacterium]
MRHAFSPVAITGMHRSGTSMITRGLHESGLHLIGGAADALLEAADDNPEGFWENKAIVACNDDLLEATGGAWDNPPALLPRAVDDPRVGEVVEPATAALAGLAENDRWGFKDPRLCLTAAFWLDLQPDLRFVICVRNPLEVALSLKRRNQNSYSLGLSLWERYYASVLELVPAERRIVTHYDAYFLDPVGELARVCDFVGLEPAALDVRSDLRHHDVGVSLDEAGASTALRELYAELCDEAGVAAPRPIATDEGRVRRLVLDGTVSARHAEQRQVAITRLEERLAESTAKLAELRGELAEVRQESESRRRDLANRTRDVDKRDREIVLLRDELANLRNTVANRLDTLVTGQAELAEQNRRLHDLTETVTELAQRNVDTTERIDDRTKAATERIAHMDDILAAVHVKLRSVEDEVRARRSLTRRLRGLAGRIVRPGRRLAGTSAGKGVPAAKKVVRASARRLPTPVKHNVHRVRRAVADGQAGNRLRERGVRAVDKLPTPAQRAARSGVAAANRAGVVPKARRVARAVVRRLPSRARTALQRSGASSTAPAGRAARPTKKAAPAPRPTANPRGRAAAVPKGPAAFKWQKSYERMVSEVVPTGAAVAVATPGCKAGVERAGGRDAVPFPGGGETPPSDAVALIAVVEAMRVGGIERLVVPEGARAWIDSHPELRDHLATQASVVEDRAGAGIVFDLTTPPAGSPGGLLAEINGLATGLDTRPAVLDWTADDVSAELPGFTTFSPPDPDRLPYFDRSVDVVVATPDRDLDAADRVASIGVVVVGDDNTVIEVRPTATTATQSVDVAVIDAGGRPTTTARATDAGYRVVADAASVGAADVVVLVDPGVIVMPGALDALVSAVTTNPAQAAVPKVLGSDGRVVAAGGFVFADGSAAGIAAGSLDVRAPWHEFVRPVCWGAGMLAVAADRFDAAAWSAAGSIPPYCGRLWEAGTPVAYQPDSTVVADDDADIADATGYWLDRRTTRPTRPGSLGDGAWRYLVANERLAAATDGTAG